MQRTTTSLIALLAAAALAAPSAHGAATLTIRGAGYGHGVGMSQYGAYGYAQKGRDYRFILAHYYTGTALGALTSEPTVRVLLQTGRRASFSGATRAGGRRLDPARSYSVVVSGLTGVALRSASGRTLQTFADVLSVTGPDALALRGVAQNGVSSGSYRGALEFRPSAVGALESINAVGLEDYVRGVVGAESPPSWPAEALRAQAVAARTYAITTGGGAHYDQFADTRSQMYRGLAAETPSTDAAVASTAGEVVTYQGKPVVTYFFSTSGGRTEDVENSFIGSAPKPWLKSVNDPYDNLSPKHRWGPLRMTMRQAARRLGGLVKGSFKGIDVVRRGRSPRVVYADVVGSRGRTRVTGPQLRARFGLFDTWATFNTISSTGKPANPAPSGGTGAPPADGQTGGVQPGGGARAAWIAQRGTVAGRVGLVRQPTAVALQRRGARGWEKLAIARTDRRGRYRFGALGAGVYRVVWRGDAGPTVRV